MEGCEQYNYGKMLVEYPLLLRNPNEVESSDQVDTSALWKELESQMASVPSFKEPGAMTFKQFILPDGEELTEDVDDTIEVIAE